MVTKEFFEKYPLYRKLQVVRPYHSSHISDVATPAINMKCRICNSIQTFNINNNLAELTRASEFFWGKTLRAVYQCSSCKRHEYIFFFQFILVPDRKRAVDENYKGYVQKVGQSPAWSIEIDGDLDALLGEPNADLYKKGLTCESQSYGIGAYSYFRRVTENIIDDLLQSIPDLLEGPEKKSFYEALVKVSKTKITEKKIELVKDLLPMSLRPNQMNPLSVLHSVLSEGLHGKTDEECLELSEQIREILYYLVSQIARQKKDAAKFSEGMRKILEKKAKTATKTG